MIYFTSDPHLGHANVIRHCDRPFSCVEEMDEALIANWNRKVTNGDHIYILGDLMFRNRCNPEEYLSRLKGKKHLIIGNHDREWIKKVDMDKWFESVSNMDFISTGKVQCTICHYPMLSWPHAQRTYMVYGHIHNNTNASEGWSFIVHHPRMLNAGVDVNGYEPVTFDEMVENNETFKRKEM